MSIYRFYVYAYIRSKDSSTAKAGTPYYIGKGCGMRAWTQHRKSNSGTPTPKDHSKIIILESKLSELGAFALERRMIAWWGRQDNQTGILRNRTDGGEGLSGIIGLKRSEEHKRKLSEVRKTPRLIKVSINNLPEDTNGEKNGMSKTNRNYSSDNEKARSEKIKEALAKRTSEDNLKSYSRVKTKEERKKISATKKTRLIRSEKEIRYSTENRGKSHYLDSNGVKIHCSTKDPRVLRGELVSITCGQKHAICSCIICHKEIPINNLKQHLNRHYGKTKPRKIFTVKLCRISDHKEMDIGNFTKWLNQQPSP